MAIQPLYRKFGGSSDPGDTLLTGQQAVTKGFKDAFSGIQGLMSEAEKGYAQENTLNMQEYLQNTLRQQGLGGEPVDRIAIQKQYGDMINMDQLDQTIESTKGQMITEAVDNATGRAGQAFQQSKDMATAGDAFKQTLLSAGMDEKQAQQRMTTWRTDNQFLADDVKAANQKQVDDTSSSMLTRIAEGEDYELLESELASSVAPENRQAAILKMRKTRDQMSALAEDSQAEVALGHTRIDTSMNASFEQLDNNLENLRAAYESSDSIPEGAKQAHSQFAGNLGGIFAGISDHASNSIWGAAVPRAIAGAFYGDEATGSDVGSFLQTSVDKLIGQGMSPEDAELIAVQAYQENMVRDSEGNIGTVLSKNSLRSSMMAHFDLWEDRQSKKAAYLAGQDRTTKIRKMIMDQGNVIKAGMLAGERGSQLTGKEFDVGQMFKDSMSKLSVGSNVPKKEAPKAGDTKPVNRSKIQDILKATGKLVETNRSVTDRPEAAPEATQTAPATTDKPWMDMSVAERNAATSKGDITPASLVADFTKALKTKDTKTNKIMTDSRVKKLLKLTPEEQERSLKRLQRQLPKSRVEDIRAALKAAGSQ